MSPEVEEPMGLDHAAAEEDHHGHHNDLEMEDQVVHNGRVCIGIFFSNEP
jgi:hypothetical protein